MSRGYGYPIFHYYAPLATYLGVLVHSFTNNYYLTKGLWLLTILIIGWIGIWLWAMHRKRPEAAAPAAILFTFAPYHLLLTHVRCASSEALALGLLPYLFWATERATDRRSLTRIYVACLFVALLVLSHIQSAFIYLALFGIYFTSRAIWRRTWRDFLVVSMASLFGLLLSAIYWLPFLHDLDYVRLENAVSGEFAYSVHFVHPIQLLNRLWGWGYSVEGPGDAMSFQIGWAHISIFLLSFLPYLRARYRKAMAWAFFWQCAMIGSVLLMLEPFSFVWRIVKPLQYLQFPWRLLAVSAFCSSVLLFDLIERIPARRRTVFGTVIALFGLWLYLPCTQARYDWFTFRTTRFSIEKLQSHPEDSFTTTTYKDEFLPRTVERFPDSPPEELYIASDLVKVNKFNRNGLVYEFDVQSDSDSIFVLNQFDFPAWRAVVNGKTAEIRPATALGLIGVQIPKGTSRIRIQYTNTALGRAGAIFSIMTFLILTGCLGIQISRFTLLRNRPRE